jgi:hypothetical protein
MPRACHCRAATNRFLDNNLVVIAESVVDGGAELRGSAHLADPYRRTQVCRFHKKWQTEGFFDGFELDGIWFAFFENKKLRSRNFGITQ